MRAQAVTMPCAKYFDKQTHILVRNAIMLFLCRRRGRGKGCRGIILLTSWLMVHGGCCVVGRLYAFATRLLPFMCRVQSKRSQTLSETQTEVLIVSIRHTL